MQNDSLRTQLADVIATCPLQAGPLYTTFKDLSLSVEWKDLRVMELPGTGWCAIIGHKRQEDALRAVIPLPLHTTALKPSSLRAIFSSLSSLSLEELPQPIPLLAPDIATLRRQLALDKGMDVLEEDPEEKKVDPTNSVTLDKEMIYMGIVTTDSTVVYYKLTKGIKKPADIPDE